jgi:propanediol utilization protein
LTQAHARALFGERRLDVVHTLACGDDVSDGVVGVDVGAARFERVRVLLPFAAESTIALPTRDARGLGVTTTLATTAAGGPGCTLHGPAGVIVLVAGLVAAEFAELPPEVAGSSTIVDIVVDSERPRTFRRLPVRRGTALRAFVVDDGDPVAVRGRLSGPGSLAAT